MSQENFQDRGFDGSYRYPYHLEDIKENHRDKFLTYSRIYRDPGKYNWCIQFKLGEKGKLQEECFRNKEQVLAFLRRIGDMENGTVNQN